MDKKRLEKFFKKKILRVLSLALKKLREIKGFLGIF
jgi:hypothetical protein